ncbi:HAD-IA family hydrolase [Granulicella cerasi]|uniref:HAD-IA family hydrolase n=1 Tax=Granulicella cerasi TaxID=741063 RepID=A0ABW1Z766_9BACT|nr:HAD-IA family hydrolase [Granulicella cerasi]
MASFEAAALLFDMDGVLLSSIASAERCWKLWAKHYELPNWETFTIPHGVRAIDIVKMSAPWIDADEGLRVIEDMEIADVADVKVLPGAAALLASLPEGRWTIVTSASKRLMEARVKAAGLPLPPRFITANDVVKGKPDPEPYRKGAELLGFDPAQCVVVEDAPSGIKAGHGAGARVLGVVTSHTAEQVHEARADWVVQSLADVKLIECVGALMEFTAATV